ncbi:MAG: hypothetical protein HYS08_10800 [Chlamydiae bacterium]|nr:hypothetical protein [Chlamydiota bacterium]MBI3266611.1 hypothetical protein [Chlamydiota bacterium]
MLVRQSWLQAVLFLMILNLCACSNKLTLLEDKLKRTIEEGDQGRIKRRIISRMGGAFNVDNVQFKQTFQEDYTYVAIVTFKKKNIQDESQRRALPQLGNLPSTDPRAGQVHARFKYLEEEDRWYFDQFV